MSLPSCLGWPPLAVSSLRSDDCAFRALFPLTFFSAWTQVPFAPPSLRSLPLPLPLPSSPHPSAPAWCGDPPGKGPSGHLPTGVLQSPESPAPDTSRPVRVVRTRQLVRSLSGAVGDLHGRAGRPGPAWRTRPDRWALRLQPCRPLVCVCLCPFSRLSRLSRSRCVSVPKSLPPFSPWKRILILTSSKRLQIGGENRRPGICCCAAPSCGAGREGPSLTTALPTPAGAGAGGGTHFQARGGGQRSSGFRLIS